MILEIFRDSFEYTFKDRTMLKIGILSLLSFLFIPMIILGGYSYRTIYIGVNSMINKNNRKPDFTHPVEMLIQGIKTIIIALIYNLPSIIATYLAATNGLLFTIIRTSTGSRIDFNLESMALLAIIWFITLLFTCVAIPHMIDNNGSIKAGFRIRELLTIIKSVGILNYIKFSLTNLIIFTGIILFVFLLIQLLISLISGYGLIMTGSVTIVLYLFLGLFLIFPIFLLSESRAIALIYNMK